MFFVIIPSLVPTITIARTITILAGIHRKSPKTLSNPNRYTIYAMELSDTVLQFKVELTDPSYGNPDENVLASVVNLVQFFRPNGTAIINGVNYTTVQRSTPTSSTISAF